MRGPGARAGGFAGGGPAALLFGDQNSLPRALGWPWAGGAVQRDGSRIITLYHNFFFFTSIILILLNLKFECFVSQLKFGIPQAQLFVSWLLLVALVQNPQSKESLKLAEGRGAGWFLLGRGQLCKYSGDIFRFNNNKKTFAVR